MRRKALYAVALLGLAVYAWLAIAVYRSKADPESFKAWDGSGAWVVGPSGKVLKKAADRRMDLALEVLDELDFNAYREHLLVAEDLLERSLRAQPGQPEVLARLAAVRWELQPALTDEGMAGYLELIETASELAPHSPVVQFRLGRLLMAMGREEDALPYLRRAAHLRPQQTQEIASLLLARRYRPPDLLDILPDEQDVVAKLGKYFRTKEDGSDIYLQACEQLMNEPTMDLLRWYGIVCRWTEAYRRLEDNMQGLDEQDTPEIEAERLMQLGWAASGLGRHEDAIARVRTAIGLQSEKAALRDGLGDIAWSAGEYELARRAYSEAIGLLAKTGGAVNSRAFLYRKIGQMEERNRRPDKAYDAYRRALELNPDEPVAEKKIRKMREAAGIN